MQFQGADGQEGGEDREAFFVGVEDGYEFCEFGGGWGYV